MALAAGPIVVLIRCLFNCHGLDIGIGPGIKLEAVKANALFPYRKFTDEWPYGVFEFVLAHAEIPGRIFCAQESRLQARLRGCSCI